MCLKRMTSNHCCIEFMEKLKLNRLFFTLYVSLPNFHYYSSTGSVRPKYVNMRYIISVIMCNLCNYFVMFTAWMLHNSYHIVDIGWPSVHRAPTEGHSQHCGVWAPDTKVRLFSKFRTVWWDVFYLQDFNCENIPHSSHNVVQNVTLSDTFSLFIIQFYLYCQLTSESCLMTRYT